MEENKTGKNVSSGAKKVAAVERKTSKKPVKSTSAQKTNRAQAAEAVAAEKRIEEAKLQSAKKEKKYLQKAELKQKKLEKKAELKQKKLEKKAALAEKKAARKQKKLDHIAMLRAKKAERKAEHLARKELLKNESKQEKQKRLAREKQERLALKKQKLRDRAALREQKRKERATAHARRAEDKRHKREQRTQRKHAPGFGGWLAAVISLGVACLALATVVTAGAMRMNDMTIAGESGYRSTLFELVSVSEDMDSNLAKLRVSGGREEQRKLITDVLVDSALMEAAIERIPIDSVTGTDISAFVNKTGSYMRTLLKKLAAGDILNERERSTLEYLYSVNAGLQRELNDMAMHMTESEFKAFLEGKEGSISQKFAQIGQGAKEEPKEAVDAPFSSEGNVGKDKLEDQAEISRSRAEELVKGYFKDYHVDAVTFTGETAAKNVSCYNFSMTDANGTELYAQITKRGGHLAFFDTYEPCTQKNFDLETCDALAKDFLSSVGIEGVEAVWLTDTGMVANITYVRVQDGVRIYPEMVRVRVCESKGRVVGVDAVNYLLNHEQRSFTQMLPMEQAQQKLSASLVPYAAHPALIPVNGENVLTYEFACTMGEEEYIVYLDAVTGEEVEVYRVRNSKNGSYLQ